MKSKLQNGFGSIEVILIILAIVITGTGGWYVWSKADNSKESATSAQHTSAPTNKNSAKQQELPPGFVEYANAAFDFSFAYPQKWGSLAQSDASSPIEFFAQGPLIHKPGDHLDGHVSVAVNAMSDFSLTTHKYGPTVSPVVAGNGLTWKVTQIRSSEETYKVGDTYTVQTRKSASGVTIYDLSYGDEGFMTSRWAFVANGKIIVITQPSVGPYYTTTQTEAEKTAQQEIINTLIDSIRSA